MKRGVRLGLWFASGASSRASSVTSSAASVPAICGAGFPRVPDPFPAHKAPALRDGFGTNLSWLAVRPA